MLFFKKCTVLIYYTYYIRYSEWAIVFIRFLVSTTKLHEKEIRHSPPTGHTLHISLCILKMSIANFWNDDQTVVT